MKISDRGNKTFNKTCIIQDELGCVQKRLAKE